jgi:hypothetical protein
MSIDSMVGEWKARDNEGRLDKGRVHFVQELRDKYTDEEKKREDEVRLDESSQVREVRVTSCFAL